MKKLVLPWQGMNIKITYESDYSQAVKTIQGYQLAHIEVRHDSPLPITETGYRSLFLPDKEVQEAGGVIKLIRAELDRAAQSKEWKQYKARQSQLKLF